MQLKNVYSLIIILLFSIKVSAQQPRLILPIGHAQPFTPLFSPDGKKIMSISGLEPSKIWDAETGKLLLDSLGYRAGTRIDFAAFSPDGKKIVTCYYGDTANIWDASSGKLLVGPIKNLAFDGITWFSPDGKYLLFLKTGHGDDSLSRTWDASSGKMLTEIRWTHQKAAFTRFGPDEKPLPATDELALYLKKYQDQLLNADISSDGKKIETVVKGGVLKIWNSFTGQLQTSISEPGIFNGAEQFSPDGKKIITFNHLNKAKIWDAVTGQMLIQWDESPVDSSCGLFSPDGKKYMLISIGAFVVIRDVITGSLLFDSKTPLKDFTFAQFLSGGDQFIPPKTGKEPTHRIGDILADAELLPVDQHLFARLIISIFSPDGKKLVFPEKDFTGSITDVSTGRVLASLKGHTPIGLECAFSPDGNRVLTGILGVNLKDDSDIQLRDLATGRMLIDLKNEQPQLLLFSDDGKKILLLGKEGSLKLLDAANGNLLLSLRKQGRFFKDASLSHDGKKIMTFEDSTTLKIWDALSGNLLADIKRREGFYSYRTRLSADAEKIATTVKDTIKIIDISTGNMIRQWDHQTNKFVEFSPDNKKIRMLSNDNKLSVWDISTGNLLFTLPVPGARLRSVKFSPGGDKILTVTDDGTVKLWDAASGKLSADLSDSLSYDDVDAQFSRDGQKIITTVRDGTIRIWDVGSGKILTSLKGNSGVLYNSQAVLSPDEKRLITYWGDNTFRTWDTKTGELLYKSWAVDSADHLVVDRFNRFDGTEAARKLLYFVCGDEIVELDQVKDQLWVPNLAERLNAGETINAKTLSDLNICGLTPQVEKTNGEMGEYSFTIKPRRGGLGETVLYINGIEVRRYKPAELQKNGDSFELLLKKQDLQGYFVAGKENPVTIRAYTSDNTISSRGLKVVEDKTKESLTPPDLYAVMIGVSDYKGDELDLKYAAKDATDISLALANAAKKLLNNDGKEHVFMYNLTTTTDHYQLPEKNSIKKVLEEIGKKATANDILLVFFAGHGVMEGTDKKQFYFLTADASQASVTDAIADVGISMAELSDWMKPQNIKAQKRILILDACNSGQAINDFVQMGKEDQGYLAARNDDKSQQIKAIDKLNERSGLFILSASATNQSAYEMGRYSQGLLTYSLLKAIKQQPDILNDGKYLDVGRWFTAAKESVTDLAKESGARQEPQIVSNTDFNIGVVDADVIAKIVLPDEKPLFAACNFQNADENIAADNLGLNRLTDQELGNIAARGTTASIVYAGTTNSPEAYNLSGRYSVSGNTISIKLLIRRNNEVKQRIDLSGTTEKPDELAALIAAKAAEWANRNK